MAHSLSRRSFLQAIPGLAALAAPFGLGGLLNACGDLAPPENEVTSRRRAYTRNGTVPFVQNDDDEYVPADERLTPVRAANETIPLPNVDWQARASQLEGEQVRLHRGVFTSDATRNGVMSGKERSHVPKVELAASVVGLRSVMVVLEHVMAAPRTAADGGATDGGADADAGDGGAPPSSLPDHYITTIYLRADVGGQNMVVGLWEFAPDDAAPPGVRFTVPDGATNVVAYAACTLHGLWRSDPLPE
jgi:hypothetical protein